MNFCHLNLSRLVSPLPHFHSAVKEAHNVVSQVDFQHWYGARPILPPGRVYTHWSIHTKVDSKGCEHHRKKQRKGRHIYFGDSVLQSKSRQLKNRKVVWGWRLWCLIEMSKGPLPAVCIYLRLPVLRILPTISHLFSLYLYTVILYQEMFVFLSSLFWWFQQCYNLNYWTTVSGN